MTDLNPFTESFRMHDERGFPLTAAIALGGERVNVLLFFLDAMVAGWSPERAVTTIREARVDNGLPFDGADFHHRASVVWTKGGCAWEGARNVVMETPSRVRLQSEPTK